MWAVSAPVLQGKRMTAVITLPSRLVRAPAPLQDKLLAQVRPPPRPSARPSAPPGAEPRCPALNRACRRGRPPGYPAGMPDFRDVIPGTRASAGRVSLAELQAAMASGELTSAALTAFYLYRSTG